jgi:hypothetical protein
VHASSHIIYRKITAGLILALFLFIHAEKVFHKHQQETVPAHPKAIAVAMVNANCPICDFQVSKDSELPVLTGITIASICWQKKYANSSAFYHYLPSTQISNRGPPVS